MGQPEAFGEPKSPNTPTPETETMAKTRDQLEQPFEAWVAERRAILVNQRAFVGQPARVKTKARRPARGRS